ncbi:hypothetical protein B9Z55_004046 [Caenorhabditis nigoni]|uniref:Sushi domain-containing protein n=1 Tax=Caenorhabditis nigoni TaxID=1611254 RepID=A0A2G5UUP7_9PELO|nr:hypothetical protein B9Z55_004046 [Caenorhabditis nigoni]
MWLLLFMIPGILISTGSQTTTEPILDCGFLNETFQYTTTVLKKDYNYSGECCNSEAVQFLNGKDPAWRLGDKVTNVRWATRYYKCGSFIEFDMTTSTTNSTTSTTKISPNISSTTVKLDCFWLQRSFSYPAGTYDGSCCISSSVNYMDNEYPSWATEHSEEARVEYVKELRDQGFCEGYYCDESFPNWGDLDDEFMKTLKCPIITEPACFWLAQPFKYYYNDELYQYSCECCNSDAVKYLSSYPDWEKPYNSSNIKEGGYIRELNRTGHCGGVSTTPSTTTTIRTTTETTSIPTTSNALNCGVFNNTECCTEKITECLDSNNYTWHSLNAGFEYQLKFCGCVLSTISTMVTTTTSMETTTTTSKFNCSWLFVPFEDDSKAWPTPFFSYNGSCCSETAVDTLKNNSLGWVLDNTDVWIKRNYLMNLLYCTEGACTYPPLWENCSYNRKTTTLETTTEADSTTDSDSTTPSDTTMSPDSTSTGYESSTTQNQEVTTSPTTSSSTATATATDNDSTSTASIGTSSSKTATVVTTAGTTVTTPETTTPLPDTTSSGNSTSSGGTTAPTTAHSLETTTAATTITTTSTNGSAETTMTTPTTTVTTSSSSTTTTSGGQTNGTSSSTSGQSTMSSGTQTTSGTTVSSSRVVSTTISTKPGTTTNVDGVYSSTTPLTTPIPTITFNWPTGTTRILPSGEIILSEVLQAFPNCTTVLKQLIFNPSTNETREEVSSNPEGCKTTFSSSYVTSPMTTPTPSTTAKTTTYNWPTGGTTRMLPNGDIILSESLIAYKNCTTVLMQLIYTPSTNETRTETTVDEQGCKASSTTISPSKYSTTPMPTTKPTQSTTARTTTFNWPTGGTTRVLPSGEIILSESLIAYKNCTTVLMQLIYNPSTNETRTETTTDAQGCKASSSSTSSKVTTTPMPTTVKSTTPATTTFAWPTGGTTRTLPSGEIILSESLIAYKNCTTVLMQLIYNPKTNTTRTESTSDAEGCKATTTTAAPSVKTTTYNWPTGGTTRVLPSGEIILSESLIAYKNCTTVLMQLIYNPATNTTRTETTSDAEGCKATSSSSYTTTPMSGSTTPSPSEPTTTFAWPTGGTTRILPSGEIIISESLIAYKNCTTVLMQLIYNPSTNTTRTETTADAQGCKASSITPSSASNTSPMTTSTPTSCVYPDLDLTNTIRPTEKEVKTSYSIGEQLVHICKKYYAFEIALQPFKLYQCMPNGKWAGVPEKCIAEKRTEL